MSETYLSFASVKCNLFDSRFVKEDKSFSLQGRKMKVDKLADILFN